MRAVSAIGPVITSAGIVLAAVFCVLGVLALIEALCEGDPTAWVHAIAWIMTRAHLNDAADAAEALEAITHAAADPALPYGVRQCLYEAATAQQLPAIARLYASRRMLYFA